MNRNRLERLAAQLCTPVERLEHMMKRHSPRRQRMVRTSRGDIKERRMASRLRGMQEDR